MAKIVLASGSPRRRELLTRMGIADFDVRVPETEETYPPNLSPRETVEYISREKARAAASLCRPDEIVITADTMCFSTAPAGQAPGRGPCPGDAHRPAGRRHTVCTGVTVCRGDYRDTQSEETEVFFRPATEQELRAYIRTGRTPWTRPVPYGIQGRGALLVEKIHGDFFNVHGPAGAAIEPDASALGRPLSGLSGKRSV